MVGYHFKVKYATKQSNTVTSVFPASYCFCLFCKICEEVLVFFIKQIESTSKRPHFNCCFLYSIYKAKRTKVSPSGQVFSPKKVLKKMNPECHPENSWHSKVSQKFHGNDKVAKLKEIKILQKFEYGKV